MGGVIHVLENNFAHFLDYEALEVSKSRSTIFWDKNNGITFFHDLNRDLKKEYPEIMDKYNKRIKRFYERVKKPTLFIRLLKEQKEADEIIAHRDEIKKLLKSYNPDNEIIYLAVKSIDISALRNSHETAFNVAREINYYDGSPDALDSYFDDADDFLSYCYQHLELSVIKNNLTQLGIGRMEKIKKDFLKDINTARIDVKLYSQSNGSISIIPVHSEIYISTPKWFKDEYGQGQVLVTSMNQFSFNVICHNEGKLQICLRGYDVRDRDNKRMKYEILYKSCAANDKQLLQNDCLTWHDKPYIWEQQVSSGTTVHFDISWEPKNYRITEILDLFEKRIDVCH